MHATVRPHRNRLTPARTVPLKRARFWLICLFFFVWFCAIGGRLFWLQVVRHAEYVQRAKGQQESSVDVPPRRGSLYDRNGAGLAMTVQVDSIYATPNDMADKQSDATRLAAVVHVDPEDAQTTPEQILARLQSGHNSVRVARGVTPDVSSRVMAMGIKGVYIQKEFERFYPNNETAAQMLGFVGVDDNGLGGLEQKFDAELRGVTGHMKKSVDARRHVMGSNESEPVSGQNLLLTIDENIQFRAERALDAAMQKTQAATGTVVIQDVHTGQILALAIRPTFNPNMARRTTADLLRNHAVSDVYEPGSTFKLVTYSAALEQRVATPQDKIDCQGGKFTLAGRVIHDDKGDHFGVVTVEEALEHSSDVAAVKLALKVGQPRFYQFIRDFGFGARSGIELPGETRGLLRPENKWGASSIGSIAMGQEVGVTPVQLVSMVSTIANGGVYLPPHVLMPQQPPPPLKGQPPTPPKGSPFKPGGEIPNPLPAGGHRVISTLTAAQMREMMQQVVEKGTGRGAQLNGYSAGGKTGTAQKIDPATHRYSKTMHVASFAGFAPVNNPVISVAVVIDTPKGAYYGAEVSAPVFKDVAQQVLEYLGVPHDMPLRAGRKTAVPEHAVVEEDGSDRTGDIGALYAAANDLPTDDPLRGAPVQANAAPASTPAAGTAHAQTAAPAGAPRAPGKPLFPPGSPPLEKITVGSGPRLRVPSLLGLPMRKVIEQSAAAGLEVEITGSGPVREQAPPPGTMVPPGTKIVVRCGR